MDQTTCAVQDCDRPSRSRGWCDTHYRRWRKAGDPGGRVGGSRCCETCGAGLRKRPGPGSWPRFCTPCAAERDRNYESPAGYIAPSRRAPCAACGKTIGLTKTSAATPTCLDCRRQAPRGRIADCEFCGKSFESKRRADPDRPWTLTCSKSCSVRLQLKNGEHAWQKAPRYGRWTEGGDAEREQQRRRIRDAKRRARKATIESEPYTLAEVAERDGYRCGLCRRKVRMDLEWPHPRSASIDHIIPLSHGGEDLKRNAQLSHLRCNITKGNRIEWGQQLLIG